MGRSIPHNTHTSPELLAQVNPNNQMLLKDFIEYMDSTGKADTTLIGYKQDINIAFCWNLRFNGNKEFQLWTKRDIQRYQSYMVVECHVSSSRMHRLKAVLSSLSNFIEDMLDEDYPQFRNTVNRIKSPPKCDVLEKTVISEEEITYLLNVLIQRCEYQKACIVALAAYSGRRKSELLRFKVADFDNCRLVCNGSLYKSLPIKTKGRGKQGKLLECYTLYREFEPYFRTWMLWRMHNNIISEWLFIDPKNPTRPLKTKTVDGWYAEMSEIIGKPFYLHALRHGFTTRLVRAGIPESVIKDIMGWESVDMVNCYCDIPKDETFGMYFDNGGIKIPQPKQDAFDGWSWA